MCAKRSHTEQRGKKATPQAHSNDELDVCVAQRAKDQIKRLHFEKYAATFMDL